jgi:hypothetical protein
MDAWDYLQDHEIRQLREQVERLRSEHDLANWDLKKVRELAEENLELRLRLALLVRLLIAKGVFTAEEYASLLAAART